MNVLQDFVAAGYDVQQDLLCKWNQFSRLCVGSVLYSLLYNKYSMHSKNNTVFWSCRYTRYLIRENYMLYVKCHVLYIRSNAFVYGDLIETCFFFVASWGRKPSNYFLPITMIIYLSLYDLCISPSLYILTKF